MTQATTNNPVHIAAVKKPSTRLMDLLAGWTAFVDEEDPAIPDTVSSEEIGALYQEAGALWELTGQAHEQAVRDFILERVLPLLLRK